MDVILRLLPTMALAMVCALLFGWPGLFAGLALEVLIFSIASLSAKHRIKMLLHKREK